MTNFDAFLDRKHELLDSASRLTRIVAERLDGRDIQLLESFQKELKDDLSFKILCIGDFSSGKSTFINRFLLKQDILPAYAKPTTTRLTRVRYGETLRATFFFQDGTRELVDNEVAKRLLCAVSTDGNDAARINHVVLEVPSDVLKEGIEVIDAPGLNDPDAGRMKVTLDFLHQADAILFFLNAQQPWTRYQKWVFEQDILARKDIDKLFVLANYWDCIDSGDRAELQEYLNRELRASVSKLMPDDLIVGGLSVLPISSKTGENAVIVQEQIWNYLGQRKFHDVLSARAHRLNTYFGEYQKGIDTQILLAKQDAASRDKHRAAIERDIVQYQQQRDALVANIKRFLKPEFEEYEREVGELFDRLADNVASILDELAAAKLDVQTLNTRLSVKLSRLQDDLMHQLKRKERVFLQRVADVIEQQKGMIDLPSGKTVHLEDYFLKWERISNSNGLDNAANAAGGIGLVGTLVGLGTYMSASAAAASQGAIAALWGWAAGTAPSSFVIFGLPGLVLAAVSLAGMYLLKTKQADIQTQILIDLREQITDRILRQKNALIEYIAGNRDQNIREIGNDVDHEIKTTYTQKLQELAQISTMQDAVAVFEILRRDIDALRVKVNP